MLLLPALCTPDAVDLAMLHNVCSIYVTRVRVTRVVGLFWRLQSVNG